VPGVVTRPDVGDVVAHVLGWDNIRLGGQLRRATGVPVLIENDVKSLAVAERLFGRGRERKSFALVTIGRGVGFASVVDGALRRGAHGGAGEIGHVVVANNGAPCACGSRGCLEAYVGVDGLIAAGKSAGLLRGGQGVDRLVTLADRGNVTARDLFARAAQRLGTAIAPAIAVLDPEVILVGGEGTAAWRHWDDAFRRSLSRRLPQSMREMPMEVDEWDEYSWARGAAAIVLATPFDQHGLAGRQRTQVLARLHGVPGAAVATAEL
jgi:predicted NBD/HSP70 family sugar kinase